MKIIYVIAFLIMSFVSPVANAAKVWLYEDVLVEDASFYTVGGNSIMQVKVTEHPGNTGCAPADEHGIVYMNSSANFGANWQFVYSTILSAQAQGTPVDILVDDAVCNSSSGTYYNFGPPEGLGLKFYGVRLDGE